jgi:hypothetical protein
VAKKLSQALGIEVELRDGPYGRASIALNGEVIAKTGMSGWLPRASVIIERAKARLSGIVD